MTVVRSSNADSAMTRVCGEVRPISRAARGPPPAGMLTSISATSGCSRAAIEAASSASAAAPDERQARLLGQQLRQCVAQGRLVVGHQHANEYVGVRPGKEGAHDP